MSKKFQTFCFTILTAFLGFVSIANAAQEPRIQLVVLHSKGENWPAQENSVVIHEQIRQHGKYWHSQSIVEKGGPLLETGGGMMLLKPGTSKEEAQLTADEDPAVKTKFLKAEVREWLLFIDTTASP